MLIFSYPSDFHHLTFLVVTRYEHVYWFINKVSILTVINKIKL